MSRKRVKPKQNLWTLQLIPNEVGTVKHFNIYLYPTLIILSSAILLFVFSLLFSAHLWQQTHKMSADITYLQQYEVENKHLQADFKHVQQELSDLYEEIEDLHHVLIELQGLTENVIEIDGKISAIPTKESQLHLNDETLKTLAQVSTTTKDRIRSVEIASIGENPSMEREEVPKEIPPRDEGSGPVSSMDSTNSQSDPTPLSVPLLLNKAIELKDAMREQENDVLNLKATLQDTYAAAQHIPAIAPSTGRTTSPFGFRQHPITWVNQKHNGLDFADQYGSPIYATANGTVTFAGRNGGYGLQVRIHHGNEYVTSYSHLTSFNVGIGDTVKKGNVIGKMGSTGQSTGVHLHYEVHLNGNPVNPMQYIKRGH